MHFVISALLFFIKNSDTCMWHERFINNTKAHKSSQKLTNVYFIPLGDVGSEFKIIDNGLETSYCNLRRPPNKYKSNSDKLVIVFRKEQNSNLYTTGFRIIYELLAHEEEKYISFNSQTNISKYTSFVVLRFINTCIVNKECDLVISELCVGS